MVGGDWLWVGGGQLYKNPTYLGRGFLELVDFVPGSEWMTEQNPNDFDVTEFTRQMQRSVIGAFVCGKKNE